MAQVANVDYGAKRIYCHADTVTSGFDIIAAYFEINVLRQLNANGEQNFAHMLSAEGNIPKGGGNFTPNYGLLETGWRIVPYDQVGHTLNLITEPVSKDNLSGRDVFDRTGILVAINIDEIYEKVEIREVAVGSGLDAAQDAKLSLLVDLVNVIYDFGGHDPAKPKTITPTTITVGDQTYVLSGDGQTSSVLTRSS